jgi:hypothetical protein
VGEADEALKQRLWGMLHLASLLTLKPDEAEALPKIASTGKFLPGRMRNGGHVAAFTGAAPDGFALSLFLAGVLEVMIQIHKARS